MQRAFLWVWILGSSVLLSEACAQATNTDPAGSANGSSAGGTGGARAGATGMPASSTTGTVAASGGSGGGAGESGSTDGSATGGATGPGGSASGAAGAPDSSDGSGGGVKADECSVSADCLPVEGECIVCEPGAGSLLECVSKGSSACDGQERDACEVCDGDDLGEAPASCIDFGEPGQFSGGSITCNEDCSGFDSDGCSVCSNDTVEAGEECDGEDVPAMNCAGLGLPPPPDGAPDVDLPCLPSCAYDRSGCELCTVSAADCLIGDQTDCSGEACAGKQCAAGETCTLGCGNMDRCPDLSCNVSASCSATCGSFGRCEQTCETRSECELDCTGAFAAECSLTCTEGATCSILCSQRDNDGSGSCDVDCAPGSSCSVDTPDFKSHPMGTAYCSAGETCEYRCRNQTDCSGLSVTCAAGATCIVECTDFETTCPVVTCQDGASCSFDCPDNACNGPICEMDAECHCVGVECDFQPAG